MDIDKKQAIERAALEAKHARAKRVADATPEKKTGEIRKLLAVLKTMQALMGIYDLAAEPPSLAGTLDSTFEAALARLEELTQPKPSA